MSQRRPPWPAPPTRPAIPDAHLDHVHPRTSWFASPPPFDGTGLSTGLSPAAPARSGSALAEGLTLFHDGAEGAVAIGWEADTLSLSTDGFSGAYASLAFGFGRGVAASSAKTDIVRAGGTLSVSDERVVFVRLNLVSGPTTLTLPIDLDYSAGRWMVEWDLFHTDFDATAGRDLWVDIMLDQPRDSVLRLGGFFVSRHPRATF